MESLAQMMEQYTLVARRIRDKLCFEIDGIRDSANIRRLNRNCFTVSFSEIVTHGNLSAGFYDFDHQKSMLKEILRTSGTLETQIGKLREISETGKITIRQSGGSYQFVFHPDVTQALTVILKDFTLGDEIEKNN